MKKKHAADQSIDLDDPRHRCLTVCGYECTDAEYRRMLRQHVRYVTCKRCLHGAPNRRVVQ